MYVTDLCSGTRKRICRTNEKMRDSLCFETNDEDKKNEDEHSDGDGRA